jgi:hypothetical protein
VEVPLVELVFLRTVVGFMWECQRLGRYFSGLSLDLCGNVEGLPGSGPFLYGLSLDLCGNVEGLPGSGSFLYGLLCSCQSIGLRLSSSCGRSCWTCVLWHGQGD